MYSLPTEPSSIGRTLDSGIKLFLSSFKSVIALSILASFIMLVPQIAITIASDPESNIIDPVSGIGPVLIISFVLVYLVLIFLYIPIWAAICSKIWAHANQEESIFKQAFWRGVRLIPRFILMGICYMLAIMGGFILLIIPGIYLMLSLSMSYYLIIVDDLKGIESLKTSHQLIKGHWWRTAVIVSIPIFIIMALYVVVGFVVGIYMGVSGSVNSPDAIDPMLNHMINLASSVISAVITPLILSIVLVILHDLKLRNQGTDLMQKLEAMKNNT